MSESGYKNPPKHSRFQKGCSGIVCTLITGTQIVNQQVILY